MPFSDRSLLLGRLQHSERDKCKLRRRDGKFNLSTVTIRSSCRAARNRLKTPWEARSFCSGTLVIFRHRPSIPALGLPKARAVFVDTGDVLLPCTRLHCLQPSWRKQANKGRTRGCAAWGSSVASPALCPSSGSRTPTCGGSRIRSLSLLDVSLLCLIARGLNERRWLLGCCADVIPPHHPHPLGTV